MTFVESALRKTISIAAAVAIAFPAPVLAGSFGRARAGLVGASAPVVLRAPAALKIQPVGAVSVGILPLDGAPATLGQRQALPGAPSPALSAIERLEAAGVNVRNAGLTAPEAQQLLDAAQALPDGAAKKNIVAMAAMMAAAPAGLTGPGDAGAGQVFDNAATAAQAAVSARSGISSWFAGSWLNRAAKTPLRALGAPRTVPVAKLRWSPDADALPETTRDIVVTHDPAKPIVGQDDALKSLYYGLKMPGLHYNVFVSGPEGSGRESAALGLSKALASAMPTPNDSVQVTNFMKKDSPLLLSLSAGQGARFAEAVDNFIELYKGNILNAMNQKQAVAARKKLREQAENATDAARDQFNENVEAVRLPGGKFGLRLEIDDNEDGTVSIGWSVTVSREGRMETVSNDDDLDRLIAQGVLTPAEWDQAAKDAKAAAKPLIEAYSELVVSNNEIKENAKEQIEAVNGGMAKTLVQQLAQDVLMTLGRNRHDTPAHKAYEKAARQRIADFNAAVAKAVRLAGKYTIVLQFDGENVGVALAKVVDGKIASLSEEETREALSGELTPQAVMAAAAPYKEKLLEVYAENDRAHNKVHEADEPMSPQEKGARQYVQLMLSHAATNYKLFMPSADENSKKPDPKEIYQANVLRTNPPDGGAPVVQVEDYSFDGIFGAANGNKKLMLLPNGASVRVDGPAGASFKSGSLHEAEGGFWIANVMDLLKSPGVWPALMKAVRTGQIEIVEEGLVGLASLKGARYLVPSRTKVVLIGSPMIRMMLQQYDEDFGLNFPDMSTAQFEPTLPINEQSLTGYLQFFRRVVEGGAGLIAHHTRDAMAALLEFASKISGSNEKLTAQFGPTYSLMREATHMASLHGRQEVRREDVESALAARALSAGVYVRHHQEAYTKGIFKIETQGKVVGQINGLAVLGGGDDRGVAMRITVEKVQREPGEPLIVSLDRNAGPDVTGSSFNKSLGVVETIVRTYFGFEGRIPYQFRLSFEQNYGGIDGDSATSTIAYALISAISGVGIDQGKANTGSADQRYWVQPIGGINAKTAGFFDVAAPRGLRPGQGVLFPATNLGDLNLRQDIVQAAAAGVWNLYPINTIEEGTEVLMGVPSEEIKRLGKENLEAAAKKLAGKK